jgi:hypothetical protein
MMREINKDNLNVVQEDENNEKLYTIPNEASCSPEFSEGCVFNK